MRTQQEILDFMDSNGAQDIFGFRREVLVFYLEYDRAKEFIKGDVTEEKWNDTRKPNLREVIAQEAREYLEFAWDKANNCRGLSAARSIEKLSMWLWLYDDAAYEAFIAKVPEYDCYGKQLLVAASEYFGLDWSGLDNGHWTNSDTGPAVEPNTDVSWMPDRVD